MKKYWKIGCWGVLFLGCASTGQVKTDFDPAADFRKYTTYAYLEMKDMGGTDLLNNSLLRRRIEDLINKNMQEKGLNLVALDQNPSLLIRYWVGIKDKSALQYVGSSTYGPYTAGRWSTMYDTAVTYDYREGTLILDLIDPASKDLVWRAYLQQVLEDKDTNRKRAEINLKKAFKDYPPPQAPSK